MAQTHGDWVNSAVVGHAWGAEGIGEVLGRVWPRTQRREMLLPLPPISESRIAAWHEMRTTEHST